MSEDAKIQVGNIPHDDTLDAHLNAMDAINAHFRAYTRQFPTWPVTNGFNEAQVVDGSIVEPITDEGRLLK